MRARVSGLLCPTAEPGYNQLNSPTEISACRSGNRINRAAVNYGGLFNSGRSDDLPAPYLTQRRSLELRIIYSVSLSIFIFVSVSCFYCHKRSVPVCVQIS